MKDNHNYKKATKLVEVDNAVRFDVPISADHEFFTDFSDVRGDFHDKVLYRSLNVNSSFHYIGDANRTNKTLLFLAGMRGSGKTSELAKISKNLHNPNCFFCVTCNLDEGLDLNDMEYMDILIFQLERLFEELQNIDRKFDENIIKSLQDWFSERVKEANTAIKREGGFEMEIGTGTASILSFLGLAGKIKANLLGSKENAEKIRTVFKNNFSDFAKKFNAFIEYVNTVLRHDGLGQEIFFIIDGLEKIATADIRKKIVAEESNRIRQIKCSSIFTLPIELMYLRPNLISFSSVQSFPFVKIIEKDGTEVEEAMKRFESFIYKRIDEKLFDNNNTVRAAIIYGGGSPRELLRVLEYAYLYAEEDGLIDKTALEKGAKKLAAEASQYISIEDLEKLKILKENNDKGLPTPFDAGWQDLLEKLIIMEYNDGTYKRVNPLVEKSQLYQQYVG